MKVLILLALAAAAAFAQAPPGVIPVPTSPVGNPCFSPTPLQVTTPGGLLVTCQSGTWQPSPNGGGSFPASLNLVGTNASGQIVVSPWVSGNNVVIPGNFQSGSGSSVAGGLVLTQGTANSAGTTSITLQAPTAVTSYTLTLPGAAASGIPLWTNAAGVVTESICTGTVNTANTILMDNGSGCPTDATSSATVPLLNINTNNSGTPGVSVGTGISAVNYMSFSGGRSMIGNDTAAFSGSGALTLSAGTSKGINAYVGGTTGVFLSGTLALSINGTGVVSFPANANFTTGNTPCFKAGGVIGYAVLTAGVQGTCN